MPVNMGKEGDGGTFEGLTGNFHAKAVEVAEKLVEGKEDRPSAVRVVFQVEGKEETLSLFVPLHESAADRLHPFIPGVQDVPTDESGLRAYLAANMPGDTFFVYASNGSVRGVTAAPGKHRVKLTGLNKFVRRADNTPRVRFFAENAKRETVTWTVPYPDIVCKVGKAGREDDIGPASEFSPNQYLFEYLIAFGLDWERLTQEITDAYEDGHLFTRLGLDGPARGFFDDPGDLTDDLFQAAHRHSPNRWCEVKVVDHPQYGIGPERGAYSHIEFTPVIVEGAGGGASAEFEHEKAAFLVGWDSLTQKVMVKPDARFLAGTSLTDDGRAVAVGVLVPLVRAYPAAVLQRKPDGSPAVVLPPTADAWHLDGLVSANYTAERLLKLETGDLFDVVNLNDPAPLLAWAAEAVPEWAGIGIDDKETEVL